MEKEFRSVHAFGFELEDVLNTLHSQAYRVRNVFPDGDKFLVFAQLSDALRETTGTGDIYKDVVRRYERGDSMRKIAANLDITSSKVFQIIKKARKNGETS